MDDHDEQDVPSEGQRRKRRRPLKLALVVLLALLVLVLAPPLVNANRLSQRIAKSMSESLGRPVHLDRVSLHLLPVPGFTMENLVVSEDPAFGYEPVIRANRVEASIRVSSLWRRQVEFSSVRFVTDPNGSAPSMNLVRRADGRWNLESILLHAANENAAPTAQSKPGPAPRFPYIEARGARLNIKMGDEKEPFALTDMDLALWLPSPQQWRVRLEGRPTRTDTSVFDTGVLNIEATLARASRLADVPVEVTAEWKRTPLGQASLLLTGNDMGWRGDIEGHATAHGTLGNAQLATTLKLRNVRRSDFIPEQTLSLTLECRGKLVAMNGIVVDPACTLPVGNDGDDDTQHGVIAATADALNLTTLQMNNARVGMTQVPEEWLLDWLRLFTQRIPTETHWAGTVSGSMSNAGTTPAAGQTTGSGTPPGTWTGNFQSAPAAPTDATPAAVPPATKSPMWTLAVSNDSLTLAPVDVSSFTAGAEHAPLMLSGTATSELSRFQLSGSATRAELATLAAKVPPLSDGLAAAFAAPESTTDVPAHVEVTCTRAWNGPQTCLTQHVADAPAPAVKKRGRR